VSYNSGTGNYEIEIWLRYSDFDGYGAFTIYINLNKTNYYNQTELLNINILGLTNSQIDTPAQDQTYYSNETLNVILSFDDSVKGSPIAGANVEWKVGIGGTFSSINVTYNGGTGNYEVEIWLRSSEFDGHGPFTIFFQFNKTNYYNQTEQLNINIIGLTSFSLINLTQYSQMLILNITTFEGFMGENITVYMNFINLYPTKFIIGGTGNLTFNSRNYLNYSDVNGLYSWEMDTYQLSPGSYSFSVSFNKTFYQNQSITINFDINIISSNITIDIVFDGSGELAPYYDNGYAIYTSKGITNVTRFKWSSLVYIKFKQL